MLRPDASAPVVVKNQSPNEIGNDSETRGEAFSLTVGAFFAYS